MLFPSSSGGLSGRALPLGAAVAVCCGVVGFGLIGRSWWSVGSAGNTVAVSAGPGLTLTRVGEADIIAWSSSSCSVGIGRSGWSVGSIHSPQRVNLQSVKVPLCSFTSVSFTTTLHFPIPDSPLSGRSALDYRR